MIGPKIQQNFFFIVLQFRKYSHVISVDVEENVSWDISWTVSETILLLVLQNQILFKYTTYLNTVTYGTASALYSAIRYFKQIGFDCIEAHPVISRIIYNDFYVDDVLYMSDSLNDIKNLYVTSQILSSGY